jgi:hypothetical protein
MSKTIISEYEEHTEEIKKQAAERCKTSWKFKTE